MRIALFSRAVEQHAISGMHQAVSWCARALATKHEVVIYTAEHPYNPSLIQTEHEHGYLIKWLATTSYNSYYQFPELAFAKFIEDHKNKRYDIVLSSMCAAKSVVCDWNRDIPAVFMSHGVDIWGACGNLSMAQSWANMECVDKSYAGKVQYGHWYDYALGEGPSSWGMSEIDFVNKFDAMLAVSPIEYYDLKCRLHHPRVFMIPYCLYCDVQPQFRSANNPVMVTMCATYLNNPFKGIKLVLKELSEFPEIGISLIGEASEELAEEYGCRSHGFLPPQDACRVIADSDIFVDASLHHSGMNATVLQAQYVGCPVITFSTGGGICAVLDGVTGCVVPLSNLSKLVDAVYYLTLDRRKYSSFAHIWAKSFASPDRFVENCTKIFEYLISGPTLWDGAYNAGFKQRSLREVADVSDCF